MVGTIIARQSQISCKSVQIALLGIPHCKFYVGANWMRGSIDQLINDDLVLEMIVETMMGG